MVDADDCCQILQNELTQGSMKKWVNGEVYVHVLRRYRNWKAHWEQYSPSSFDPQKNNLFCHQDVHRVLVTALFAAAQTSHIPTKSYNT